MADMKAKPFNLSDEDCRRVEDTSREADGVRGVTHSKGCFVEICMVNL